KWFTLSNFSSLSAVLGESDSDIETALGKASKKWSEFDIIIWDDVHHLDLQTQNYLLSFLLQTSGEQTHLIMSDEHLNAPLEVPCLKMQGFSREQSLEYLKQIDIEIPQDEFENFYHLTGGLPLFIQLWIQDPGNLKRQEITFGNLSAEAKNFLSTMSFYPHQFKLEELKLTEVKNLKAVVAELQKKMLLTQVGDSFEVTPFVRDFVNHGLSTQQIQEHARQILPMLLSSPLSSKLQILSGALQAQSLDVLEELSKEFKTSWLEGVSSKNLSLLTQLTEQVQAESLKPFVLRMQLHALILQNRRSDALELADKILKKYDDLEPKEQQILFLIYECLYWMNRSEKFEVTEKRISYYVNISPLPVKFFFKVEQALPLIGKEPKSAEETLLRVAQEIAKYRDKKEDLNLVLAHTNYQLGVCTNQQRKFQEAADYFKTAHELYQECGRVYFSLFSLFNFVWALYAQKDFQKIDEWMPKISKPA
ncbi:MAG TPA: hypothetical protein VN132_15720, partial [Bdellovibrio sp.]|nr:hypothetical protein [Bdellovibrio sp.]